MEHGENREAGGRMVELARIEADPDNVRLRMSGIEELAASIRLHGIIQPLVGTLAEDGRIRLIAGHRRLAAAKLAWLAEVPVIVRDADSSVAKELQLVENVQREDLPALDVAEALQAMAANGQSAEQIAERVGKSAAWVRRHLALLKIDGKVLAAIRKNGLRFTQAEHVAKVLKTASLTDALQAAKAMASGELSRRSAERDLAKEATDSKHRQALKAHGAHYTAALNIESTIPIDSVQAKQLGELMTALDRIMTWSA